ncbi:hypothetical protein M3676_09460 [Metabacillus litoralis]|nr:hypothetical protein [Metabacillus litoralis]
MDKAIPNGKYVLPGGKAPRNKLRNMYKYCKKVGKALNELTKEEKDKFTY